MNRPLVSIVISNYNYGAFLQDAVDSALSQTWPQTEVIVVDDGSTDCSAGIIRSYGSRVIPIYQANGGQNRAINVGFAASKGDIVIFLDADDCLTPTAAERHVESFSHSGVVTSCGYLQLVDKEGLSLGRRVPHKLAKSGDYSQASLQRGLDIYGVSFTSGYAWSRSFLNKVLPMPADACCGPDGYLTAIDRFFGRIEFVPETVGLYRRHGANKGPMSVELTAEYLRNRIARKDYRVRLAADWAERRGCDLSGSGLLVIRDWRNVYMRYVLEMLEGTPSGVGLPELIFAPFRRQNSGWFSSAILSLGILCSVCLPRKYSLALSNGLLHFGR